MNEQIMAAGLEPDRDRRPWLLALLASLAASVVAAFWLAVPDTYPYGSGDNVRSGLNHLIERGPGAAMPLAIAPILRKHANTRSEGSSTSAAILTAPRWGRTVTIAAGAVLTSD